VKYLIAPLPARKGTHPTNADFVQEEFQAIPGRDRRSCAPSRPSLPGDRQETAATRTTGTHRRFHGITSQGVKLHKLF